MYFLHLTSSHITEGNLYKFNKGLKVLVKEDWNFGQTDDILIKGSIICQWLSEGRSLNILDDERFKSEPYFKYLPSKIEFYQWIKVNTDLAILYTEAQKNRLLSLIEDLYEKIKVGKHKMDEKAIEKQTESLNKLTKYLKDFQAAPKSVVNTRVYVPPVLKKWYPLRE